MSGKEWIKNLPKESNEKLIEDLECFGCDGYYKDLWRCAIDELKRRLFQIELE